MFYDQEADDRDFELFSRYDYLREAYGDPCPVHGTLRWQADCPDCLAEEELDEPLPVPAPVAPATHCAHCGGLLGDWGCATVGCPGNDDITF